MQQIPQLFHVLIYFIGDDAAAKQDSSAEETKMTEE